MARILLTGGTGYIASHTAVSLIESGLTPVLLDNFVNSSPVVLDRLQMITGVRPELVELDVLDTAVLTRVMIEQRVDAVIHFAALKAVGESVEQPLNYYNNNVAGFISVLQAMSDAKVKHIVVSSSATVYGENNVSPYVEDSVLSAQSPYGQSKVMMERITLDVAHANPTLRYAMLRYFNPVGAHSSGHIGESPRGIPNNLMPYVQQVAVGVREQLSIWGGDYETADGTGERDYIHVMDLARGHVLAVQKLLDGHDSMTLNLGTGQPVSVLQMVKAFELASGKKIPYRIAPRRAGDLPSFYANGSRAKEVLGFTTEYDIHDMCRDAWCWQSQNPNGFE